MSYFSEDGAPIPAGWTGIQDDRHYPKLSSRQPQAPVQSDQDTASCTEYGDGDSSTEAGTPPALHGVTRMEEESEEDSDQGVRSAFSLNRSFFAAERAKDSRPGRQLMQWQQQRRKAVGTNHTTRPGARRKRNQKTYGKKNKARNKGLPTSTTTGARGRQPVDDDADSLAPLSDGGPLVRLREGIVVDWNPDAWDKAFSREGGNDDSRGAPTFLNIEELPDPDLVAARKARTTKRKSGLTLDECLDEFEKSEVLSEQDMWYCPRCKEHRRATKKMEMWRTPDIFIAHLKRFSSVGWRRDKLDTTVTFPVEGLDLTKRIASPQPGKQEIYDLIAVDDHWGGLGGGHYTAKAKNFIDNQWYDYNGKLFRILFLKAGRLTLLTNDRLFSPQDQRSSERSLKRCVRPVLPPTLQCASR